MGRLQIRVAECEFKELDRKLKDHFIDGLNDDGMIMDTMWELTSMMDGSLVTSGQALAWAQRVEAQSSQTTMLDSFKRNQRY